MAAILKKVYFDILDDIVDEYNNTVLTTIGIKSADVKSYSYAEYNVNSNEKDPKFKVRGNVRISKYKTFLLKNIFQNVQKKFLLWKKKKKKNTVSWTYVINELNSEEIAGNFYEKELQKTNQEKIRIEKVIKKRW